MAADPRPVRGVVSFALALILAACGAEPGASTGATASRPAPTTQASAAREAFRVLVFSRTAGFRHDSIADGIAAVAGLGDRDGFGVDATEDGARFDDATLSGYRVVVFLNTSGDVLDDRGQRALERWVRAGGGWVGVHAAADTEYGWAWYGELVGAYFERHPAVQRATVRVTDRRHPSTAHLPSRWERTDEWYDFRSSPRPRVRVLASLDESTYAGGGMGPDHPIAWCHEYDGGRAWYTAGGHTRAAWAEPLFLEHLLGGIRWAAAWAGPACRPERA